MDPKKFVICLFVLGLPVGRLAVPSAVAAEGPVPLPPISSSTIPDSSLSLSPETSSLEEGKALYENGQLIAALGKFMTVLRNDPHNPEARQYLRMIVDIMRQNPSISSDKMGTQGEAAASNPAIQEEIRRMLLLRSRLTMDLKAIPGVQIVLKGNVNQVWVETPLFFADNSGGLKEQGVPILDRVAAWLKTYGQQPVIIHCYPEETQEASINGSLFLKRYSELFSFFVDERKLPPQRFVSADLLKTPEGASEDKNAVALSSGTARIVIETIGSQSALLEAMPSMDPGHALSQWLEDSVVPNTKVFNPEEGEWVNLDLAAISRAGLRSWTFTITSVESKTSSPVLQVNGMGNLLKRLSWDGHDQKSGNFVSAGNYLAKLSAINSDGTIKDQEAVLQVERTTKEAPAVVAQPKPKMKHHMKKPKAKVVDVKTPSPLVGEGQVAAATGDGGANNGKANPPPQSSPTRGEEVSKASAEATPPAEDTGDSVHAIWKQVIQFDPNQSEMLPTVKSSLERIGKTLEVYPLQKVRITGFAMTSETNAADLAKKRAEMVRAILVDEYHVDAKRVIVSGGKTVGAENSSKVEMSITN